MNTPDGLNPNEEPDNTDLISDFAVRSRELGHYIRLQSMNRGREPVEPADRERVRAWTLEARNHSPHPDALDIDYLDSGKPLDYAMLEILYQQHSDLVKDVG